MCCSAFSAAGKMVKRRNSESESVIKRVIFLDCYEARIQPYVFLLAKDCSKNQDGSASRLFFGGKRGDMTCTLQGFTLFCGDGWLVGGWYSE